MRELLPRAGARAVDDGLLCKRICKYGNIMLNTSSELASKGTVYKRKGHRKHTFSPHEKLVAGFFAKEGGGGRDRFQAQAAKTKGDTG